MNKMYLLEWNVVDYSCPLILSDDITVICKYILNHKENDIPDYEYCLNILHWSDEFNAFMPDGLPYTYKKGDFLSFKGEKI